MRLVPTSAPFYGDDLVTLHQGDALRLLEDLDDGSIDACIADPPYSSGGTTPAARQRSTRSKYVSSDAQHDLPDFDGDTRDARSYGYWSALWMSEVLRATAPGGVLAVFSDWRQLPTTSDAIQAGGWTWRGVVPWWKPAGRPTRGRWANQCEYLVWGTNGARSLDTLDGKALPGFYQAHPPRDREHQTQKPVEVLRQLVRIVPAGGVVLDPFMGSGTTGCAAVLEGRRFVGFERSRHFVQVARGRILEAQAEAAGEVDQLAG